MSFNESTWDRVIRILEGLAFGGLTWMMWPGVTAMATRAGIGNVLIFLMGIEVFATGVIGWSPVYALFHYSTRRKVRV